MIWEVIVVARQEDTGLPYWTYSHSEQFVPTGDEADDNVAMSGAILERLDEAATAIARQANADLSRPLRPDTGSEEDADG